MSNFKNGIFYKYLSGWRNYFSTLKFYGFKGLIEYLRQRSRIKFLPKEFTEDSQNEVIKTSITHIDSYLNICNLASKNEKMLNNFREFGEYQIILDHLSRKDGELCLKLVQKDSLILSNLIFATKMLPGNPMVFDYPDLGKLSPTDIRYAKIVKDLASLFSFKTSPKICEIGVGFGGQAVQCILYFTPYSYTFIDLPEVLELAKSVTSRINLQSHLIFEAPETLVKMAPDLVISNYAFSELTRPHQDLYLEKIIGNSKRGYMLYNHIHEKNSDSYSAFEVSSFIPGSIILEENPLTYNGNVLLVWGCDNEVNWNRFRLKYSA